MQLQNTVTKERRTDMLWPLLRWKLRFKDNGNRKNTNIFETILFFQLFSDIIKM